MNNKIKTIIFLLIAIITTGAVLKFIKKEQPVVTNEVAIKETIPDVIKKPISLCYYRADKIPSTGLFDKAWIKLNLLDEKVTGEFQNLPAEKDSKIGTFEGTAGQLDQSIMGRRANIWWNSQAEGMNIKEELSIEWGDGGATAGFGEMVDRGDGVYIYKDKSKLVYIKPMTQIDFQNLDEKLFIEKYVKDNIKTISPVKAVLGGSWYVISIMVNPVTLTGEVSYEDGHISKKASFIYLYDQTTKSIIFTKFELLK